jgi:glutamate/tyrosine decarboxylase-like PLP-dependent enzyme
MTLQLLGTDAIQSRLRHHLAMAEHIESWIREEDRFEMPYPRSFNIITFRFASGLDPTGALTKSLHGAINSSGRAYMTHAVISGRSLIRWVPGQTNTGMEHITDTWKLIQRLADQILPT